MVNAHHTPGVSPAGSADAPPDETPQLEGSIWFRSGQQNWGNQRRMALLAAIGTEGSITAAAKAVGLSYKAAWDAVDAMNNLAGEVLVLRTTGGQRGGGAQLTTRAQQLLQLYQALQQEHQRFLSRLAGVSDHADHNLELIRHMMTQVSIRNRLTGTVLDVRTDDVVGEVTLALNDALRIVAAITHESVRNLALQPGKRAIALIKASSVMIGLPDAHARLSARNQLLGKVSRVQAGGISTEVNLSLSQGYTITATLGSQEWQALGLSEGDAALAVFQAANVMLGVLD